MYPEEHPFCCGIVTMGGWEPETYPGMPKADRLDWLDSEKHSFLQELKEVEDRFRGTGINRNAILVEVTFIDEQLSEGDNFLWKLLKEQGFELKNRWRNRNSDNVCNQFTKVVSGVSYKKPRMRKGFK